MKSILQKNKECFFCETTMCLEEHHVFGGPNRRLSEKFGLKIWACHRHHNEPPFGVHFNKDIRDSLQALAQEAFEEHYPDLNFREIFGKNYK